MGNLGIIFRREFRSYFDSPVAYIFLILFLAVNSGWYMMTFFLGQAADMRGFFGTLPLFNLFFLPAVTMRLWAEDNRIGTIELLMTLPMRPWQIVGGKYLASLAFYALGLVGTLPIPIMLEMLGNPDMGAVVAGYVGSFLLGAFYLAVGIFASGLFRDQIAAFLVAFVLCFFFFLVGEPTVAATVDGWVSGVGGFLQDYVGLTSHFTDVQRGVIDGRNVVYFVTMSLLFLALNTMSLEGRRY